MLRSIVLVFFLTFTGFALASSSDDFKGTWSLMSHNYGTNDIEVQDFYFNFVDDKNLELAQKDNPYKLPCTVSSSDKDINSVNSLSQLISADYVILCKTSEKSFGGRRELRYSLEKVQANKYVVFEILGKNHIDEMFFLIKD